MEGICRKIWRQEETIFVTCVIKGKCRPKSKETPSNLTAETRETFQFPKRTMFGCKLRLVGREEQHTPSDLLALTASRLRETAPIASHDCEMLCSIVDSNSIQS